MILSRRHSFITDHRGKSLDSLSITVLDKDAQIAHTGRHAGAISGSGHVVRTQNNQAKECMIDVVASFQNSRFKSTGQHSSVKSLDELMQASVAVGMRHTSRVYIAPLRVCFIED